MSGGDVVSGTIFDPHTGVHCGPARSIGVHFDCTRKFHTPRTFSRSLRVDGINKRLISVIHTGKLGRRHSHDFGTSMS